jgi:hypothetical protein
MKTDGGVDVNIPVFLNSVLDGCERSGPLFVFVSIRTKIKYTQKHCATPLQAKFSQNPFRKLGDKTYGQSRE